MWRTPQAHNATQGPKSRGLYDESLRTGKHAITLVDQVRNEPLTGMWPTPVAHDATGPRGKNNTFSDRHHYPHDLATAVIFPTPRSSDAEHAGPHQSDGLTCAAMFPTPRAIYGEHPGMTDARHLTGAAMLPTPAARDWKSGASQRDYGNARPLSEVAFTLPTPKANAANEASKHGTGGPDLQTVAGATTGYVLNPTWVERLMGMPDGWTDVDYEDPQSLDYPVAWLDGSWDSILRVIPRPPRGKAGKYERDKIRDRLRAIGNAVVPQVAQAVIALVLEPVVRAHETVEVAE